MITTYLLIHIIHDSTTRSLNLLPSFIPLPTIVLFSLHVQLCLYHLVSTFILICLSTLLPVQSNPYSHLSPFTNNLCFACSKSMVFPSCSIQSMWLKFSPVSHPSRPFVSPGSYSYKWLKYWSTRSKFVPLSLYVTVIMWWLTSLFLDSFHPNCDICSLLKILLELYKWLTQ